MTKVQADRTLLEIEKQLAKMRAEIADRAVIEKQLSRLIKPCKIPSGIVTFQLTAVGRAILADAAQRAGLSQGKYLSQLINQHAGQSVKLRFHRIRSGRKFVLYLGKSTLCVWFTGPIKQLLNQQVKQTGVSRGDYLEYLIRTDNNYPQPWQ